MDNDDDNEELEADATHIFNVDKVITSSLTPLEITAQQNERETGQCNLKVVKSPMEGSFSVALLVTMDR